MKRSIKIKAISIVIGVMMVSVGCAGKKAIVVDTSMIKLVIREITFPSPLFVPADFKVTDRSDPEQLIKKGISLSEAGRNAHAAEFFQKAAGIQAPDNRLKIATLFAAAGEYLELGNMRNYMRAMSVVDRRLDKLDRASLCEQEATLMALYDIARGKEFLSGIHPEPTRELFNNIEED